MVIRGVILCSLVTGVLLRTLIPTADDINQTVPLDTKDKQITRKDNQWGGRKVINNCKGMEYKFTRRFNIRNH